MVIYKKSKCKSYNVATFSFFMTAVVVTIQVIVAPYFKVSKILKNRVAINAGLMAAYAVKNPAFVLSFHAVQKTYHSFSLLRCI